MNWLVVFKPLVILALGSHGIYLLDTYVIYDLMVFSLLNISLSIVLGNTIVVTRVECGNHLHGNLGKIKEFDGTMKDWAISGDMP